MIRLRWINDSVSTGDHNNLMHNAYYATEQIAISLKRQNCLIALRNAYDAELITKDAYEKLLVEVLNNEGFNIKISGTPTT